MISIYYYYNHVSTMYRLDYKCYKNGWEPPQTVRITKEDEDSNFHHDGFRINTLERFNPLRKKIRPYHYMCYNRQPKLHRTLMVAYLMKENLLDKGMVSLASVYAISAAEADKYQPTYRNIRTPIYTEEEKAKALETILAAPKQQSNTSKKFEAVLEKHKTFENYVQTTEIECQTARDKSIFIDYKGNVWPCCWQGHYYSGVGEDKGAQKRIDDRKDLEDKYGKGFNDLTQYSIFDILKTEYFANDLVSSWDKDAERLYICGKTCGKELDFRGNGEGNFDDTEIAVEE